MVADVLLIAVYGELKIPADRLLADPALGNRFVDALAQKTTEPIVRQRELSRVLSLRKMGQLPRLQRSKRM